MQLPHSGLIWFMVGTALFMLELFVPAFVLFFFAIGAWITVLANWLRPLSLEGQLIVFIVSSLISLTMLRGFVQKIFRGKSVGGDSDSVQIAPGASAEVIDAIRPPAEGRIKFSGTTWRAASDEAIGEGEIVRIITQEGLLMRVQRFTESTTTN